MTQLTNCWRNPQIQCPSQPEAATSTSPSPSRRVVAFAPQGQHPRRTTSKPTTQPIRFLRHPRRLVVCFLLQARRHAGPTNRSPRRHTPTLPNRPSLPKNVSISLKKEQSQLTSIDQMRGVTISNFEAMEQTRMPAHILAQNNDPKFQLSHGPEQWVNEWVNKFSKLHVDDWVEEFGQQVDENSADNWANVYDDPAVTPHQLTACRAVTRLHCRIGPHFPRTFQFR